MTPDVGTIDWNSVAARLRERGLRWTPQRRMLIEVLGRSSGHVTGAEVVDRCRELDPGTTPSTVYRTLDVLEELGVVRHGHGADGREEFHVLPGEEHGHLHCSACGGAWEIGLDELGPVVAALRNGRGFAVDLTHVSVGGLCAECRHRVGTATGLGDVADRRAGAPG